MAKSLPTLLQEARACTVCKAHLPLGPRPVLAAHADARILIIGQAPGKRVHESGVPWDDASGDRLREWLSVDRETFYDPRKIALVPMGFCYPGTGRSGDLPPRPECAPLWHAPLLAHMPIAALAATAPRLPKRGQHRLSLGALRLPNPRAARGFRRLRPNVRLVLLLSQYALAAYLGDRQKTTLTETVRAFRAYGPRWLPLPHPSPRNNIWLAKNPWFGRQVLPELRRRVAAALTGATPRKRNA